MKTEVKVNDVWAMLPARWLAIISDEIKRANITGNAVARIYKDLDNCFNERERNPLKSGNIQSPINNEAYHNIRRAILDGNNIPVSFNGDIMEVDISYSGNQEIEEAQEYDVLSKRGNMIDVENGIDIIHYGYLTDENRNTTYRIMREWAIDGTQRRCFALNKPFDGNKTVALPEDFDYWELDVAIIPKPFIDNEGRAAIFIDSRLKTLLQCSIMVELYRLEEDNSENNNANKWYNEYKTEAKKVRMSMRGVQYIDQRYTAHNRGQAFFI
jgi:hypothetical protein